MKKYKFKSLAKQKALLGFEVDRLTVKISLLEIKRQERIDEYTKIKQLLQPKLP